MTKDFFNEIFREKYEKGWLITMYLWIFKV
jgi:hypothetical protein